MVQRIGPSSAPTVIKSNIARPPTFQSRPNKASSSIPYPTLPELSGLVLWLDATAGGFTFDGGVAALGNGVAQWTDRSGAGNHGIQATDANQPSYGAPSARTINNIVAVEGHLGASVLASALTASDTSSSIFAVVQADAVGATRTVIGASAVGGRRVHFNPTLEVTKNGSVPVLFSYSGENLTANTPVIISLRQQINGANWETSGCFYRTDGVNTPETDTVATASVSAYTAALTTQIGSSGGNQWDGLIGEIIVYDNLLSAASALLVVNYLRAKWRI